MHNRTLRGRIRTLALAVGAAVLLSAVFTGPSLEAKDEAAGPQAAPPQSAERAPGTVVLRGDPDGVSPVQVVRAYPNLRFRRPLWIGTLPDGSGRMVVVEQDGVIRAFDNQRAGSTSTVLLDWRSNTYRRHNEEGLLGLAFHPEFAKNRTLFIHYSADSPRRGVVSRFKMDAGFSRIDPRSERVILEQAQPWGNHNGGDLKFGPDGYLYITFGDGGAGGDPLNSGQDLATWLGSILRIDVGPSGTYRVPKDNPFVGERGIRPEIWAFGLRNVWRMAFDRETGQLYAGDVGQNAWEEIDIIVRGGNYGWKVKEGSRPFGRAMRAGGRGGRGVPTPEQRARPVIDPIIEFPVSQARSITGGHVYRGIKHPELRGVYLYADYATGNIWGLRYDGAKVTQNRLLGRGRGIASFGEDAAGEVYFASFDGHIYTFEPARRQGGARFPVMLSETGLFKDTAGYSLQSSLLPYDVNVPLWSDGAAKQRHLMLPGMSKIRVNAEGGYTFPVGTIFVKTFHAGTTTAAPRLETRLMLHREQGWAGYTYVWDADQKDAKLADNRVELPLPRDAGLGDTWTVPSRADCMACHTAAGGFVLGFVAEQLDHRAAGASSSLARLKALSCFDGAHPTSDPFPHWDDTEADGARLARAYLDANCAMCHQPTGPGNATLDLRFSTPLEAMRLFEAPGQGTLGIANAKQVVPGSPRRSILRERMNRTDSFGMPSLSHGKVDRRAVKVIDDWIRGPRALVSRLWPSPHGGGEHGGLVARTCASGRPVLKRRGGRTRGATALRRLQGTGEAPWVPDF